MAASSRHARPSSITTAEPASARSYHHQPATRDPPHRLPGYRHSASSPLPPQATTTTAEIRYQQSLTINEQLGNQAGMATGYGQLGILASLSRTVSPTPNWSPPAMASPSNEQLGNPSRPAPMQPKPAPQRRSIPSRRLRPPPQIPIPASPRHQRAARRQGRHGQHLPPAWHPRPEPWRLRHPPEIRYQQALTIDERLGSQAGMATSYHQLGILASAVAPTPPKSATSKRSQQQLHIITGVGNTYTSWASSPTIAVTTTPPKSATSKPLPSTDGSADRREMAAQ